MTTSSHAMVCGLIHAGGNLSATENIDESTVTGFMKTVCKQLYAEKE